MSNDMTKTVTDELNNCVSRITFIIESIESGADLDPVCVARHGLTLVLQDIEAKLAGLRDRLTVR